MKRSLLPMFATALIALASCAPTPRPAAEPRASQAPATLDIYFIDVEGGQATLMVTPEKESFLVDAGFPGTGTFASTPGDPANARDAQRIRAAARDAGISRIDHLMVTHYHADHAGGVPELARLLPIGQFIDHAAPTPEGAAGVPGTQDVYDRYVATRASSSHLDPKPGDRLPIGGIDATVVSSVGATIATSLGAASGPNAACQGQGLPAQEKLENPRSLGVLVQFGAFRFLDIGDLSGPPLFALTCPRDRIGAIDVYLIAHHGGLDAADPTTFATLRPRVAVFNNGAAKGGAVETLAAIRSVPGIDGWQLHRAPTAGAPNAPVERIANVDESTSAWLKISARRDGSFTVTNGRTGTSVGYPARK
jgi:beta-lactamase superfamily II metal-dependent hydrolase